MSFPRYPEYKDSGVEWLGDVPAHWEVEPLKRVCSVFPSNVDKKSYEGQRPVLLCNYTDVYYNDRIVRDMAFMAATATEEQIDKFTLRKGDVIFTKDSETSDDIAIAAYVPEGLSGIICGYHLSMVRPSPKAGGLFIKRYFDSQPAKSYFAVSANGLTRVGLSQYATDNLPIPTPPVLEQEAIAAFLDHQTARIDALIAEQQRLIELLKEKRQAVISHAVTKGLDPDVPMKDSGVEWLGEVPAHWSLIRIKYLLNSLDQGWSPQCENRPVIGDEYGVMKVGCVNSGVFDPDENKALPSDLEPDLSLSLNKGDLLVSRANTRDLVGSAAVVGRDYPALILCDKLYRLRLESTRVEPEFVCHLLRTKQARGQIELAATGASNSMLNIAQSTITNLSVPLPDTAEQKAILASIDQNTHRIGALITTSEITKDLLRERRSALISAAVTGKIDVRNWHPGEASTTDEYLQAAEKHASYA